MSHDPQPPLFIDADEVARLLGLDGRAAFNRRRLLLEDEHGFPLSMPYALNPRRWRREAVLAWIAANGLPKADAPARPAGPNVVLLEMARSA